MKIKTFKARQGDVQAIRLTESNKESVIDLINFDGKSNAYFYYDRIMISPPSINFYIYELFFGDWLVCNNGEFFPLTDHAFKLIYEGV